MERPSGIEREQKFIYARVVELADSLDSGSSVHYGRAGSSPASRTKKKDTLKACLSFWVLRAVGPPPPSVIKCCSAEVNSASAKVLPAAKHPHGALVPPARRPVGWFSHTFSGFQNIDMNPLPKRRTSGSDVLLFHFARRRRRRPPLFCGGTSLTNVAAHYKISTVC